MDPKHREELEHNDLEHFFTHFSEWWAKYQNPVLITILVVVGSFSVYTIVTNNRLAARNAAWGDLANSSSPEALASVAASQSNATVRNLASLRAADLLLVRVINGGQDADATNPDDPTAPEVAPIPSDPEADLREAGRLYQQVVADKDAHAVYRLNARLGLAAVAEANQQWAAAREQYQAVIETAGEHQPAIAGQARTRLGLLQRLEQELVYAPTPVVSDTPDTPNDPSATQPAGTDGLLDDLLNPGAVNDLMNSVPDVTTDQDGDDADVSGDSGGDAIIEMPDVLEDADAPAE